MKKNWNQRGDDSTNDTEKGKSEFYEELDEELSSICFLIFGFGLGNLFHAVMMLLYR